MKLCEHSYVCRRLLYRVAGGAMSEAFRREEFSARKNLQSDKAMHLCYYYSELQRREWIA